MPLQRYRYTVWLNQLDGGDPIEVEVDVTQGDRLRAELEAGRQNLPVDPRQAPQQTTALWVWAALVRTRVVDVDYRTFRDGAPAVESDGVGGVVGRPPVLVAFQQVRDPDDPDQPATVDVPPTEAAPSASPSPSPVTSATSNGGSTPTPTND